MSCFFFKYDSLEVVNKYNKNYNHNSQKETAFEEVLRKMRNELKLRKGDDISGPDLVISYPVV